MKHNRFQAVILAAGKGTRMNDDLPKVLHLLNGRPILFYVLDTVFSCNPECIYIIIGYGSEQVQRAILNSYPDKDKNIRFIEQEEQLGTGHALLCTKDKILDSEISTMVLLGDVPLIAKTTIEKTIRSLISNHDAVTVLTTTMNDPKGYGRIIRNEEGELLSIIEEKDATQDQKKICEINTGIFLFHGSSLWHHIDKLSNQNQSREFYLTDMVKILRGEGYGASALEFDDSVQFAGINTSKQLALVEDILAEKEQAQETIKFQVKNTNPV